MDNSKLPSQELTCTYCKQEFSKRFNLRRHLKNTHHEEALIQLTGKKYHVFCIICSTAKVIGAFGSYEEYITHLQNTHQICVEENTYNFEKKDDFEVWRCSEKRDVDYAIENNSIGKMSKTLYYNCNRSYTRGLVSNNCSKKIKKTGGSIKINGTCPSRVIATFLAEGSVVVKYIQLDLRLYYVLYK